MANPDLKTPGVEEGGMPWLARGVGCRLPALQIANVNSSSQTLREPLSQQQDLLYAMCS